MDKLAKEDKESKEMFIKYHNKIRIHFLCITIFTALALFILVKIYPWVNQYINSLIKPNTIITAGILLAMCVVGIILLMIWASIWNSFTNKNIYAKYKIKHPKMNREDQSILDAAHIKIKK